ncbi:MAG: anaerobic ribonucleoside-triphosphate reductase activating protein, partial [Patescibacteria group bacterium]
FRCAYCHNPELLGANDNTVHEEEILSYLRARRGFLDGVVITGGEPTIHRDLPEFIAKIKALGLLVKLDTNGVNPAMVARLIARTLVDYVAMDLKHVWERYNTIARVKKTEYAENPKKTFAIIQSSGIDHEFRTTVLPGAHTEEDLTTMAGYLKDGEKYYLQNIRYEKTLERNLDTGLLFDVSDIIHNLRMRFPNVAIAER